MYMCKAEYPQEGTQFHDGGAMKKVYGKDIRFVLTVAATLVFLVTGGCAKTTINHSHNPNQNFTGLKNYKWDNSSSVRLPASQDPLIDKNIQFIADHELRLKGFGISTEKPDFEIAIAYDYEIDRFPSSYQLRMLTLTAYRSENKEPIWRGTAYGAINVDAASSELKKAIQNILSDSSRFPVGISKDIQLSDLGFRYLKQGHYAEAEKYLEQALSENPNNPYAILNLGAVYQNTGRAEKAR